ncbi:D-glycero-beta-D-manno-heptose-7-phosphate kinase [Azohydromonas aeria]|uniref:D-glycero-beta-D-manno-heptose-7-phosphate kinase n=1 Tax=Azohydromonas aeria TaxID=2590212 RepID=UPI0012F997FE|nr:D-glycero-beta-D-manno-heptose-7-phosphate kinase [Azohydromonas aeria]
MTTAVKPILVVGDCMLDRYWEGAVDRISPEAPVPVLQVQGETRRAGGAANVALNLVALGSEVRLLTLAGQDEAGAQLAALMDSAGIHFDPVRDPALQTIQKIRSVCRRQQLLRIDFEQPPPPQCVRALTERVLALLPQHEWVLLSDYAKGALAHSAEIIAAARRHGCKVLVDPKGEDFARYYGAWLLKPNAAELRAVMGRWADDVQLLHKAHELRSKLRLQHLLVTLGEQGMALCTQGEGCLRMPAQVREVYDVSGAGDTVLATLAHTLSRGLPLEEAVRWANRAAGIVVGKFGTASVSREELGLDAAPAPSATTIDNQGA